MWFPGRILGGVRVVMVLVVDVYMLVLDRLVGMLVLVPLAQVEPHAERHERGRGDEARRRLLAEHQQRRCRTHERSRREIGASARAAERPQREHEEDEAHAETQEAEDEGAGQREWRRRAGTERD